MTSLPRERAQRWRNSPLTDVAAPAAPARRAAAIDREALFWAGLTFLCIGLFPAMAAATKGGPLSLWNLGVDASYALALGVALTRRFDGLKSLVAQSWPLLIFLAFEAATLPFSGDVHWSSLRFLGNALRLLFVVSLIASLNERGISRALGLTLNLFMLGSIVFALALPAIGRAASHSSVLDSSVVTAWQGLFYGKNSLGHIAGLAFAWAVVDFRRRSFAYAAGSVLIAAVCVFFSRSSTGLTIAVLAPVLVWGGGLIGSRGAWLAKGAALTGAIVGILLLPVISSAWFSLLGRDATLSGRLDIWRWVWPFTFERPFVGLGYEYTLGSDFSTRLAALFVGVFSVHNAVLDLLVNTGWIATAWLAGAILFRAVRLWAPRPLEQRPGASLAACLLAVCAISSTTEAAINESTEPISFIFWTGLFLLFSVTSSRAVDPERVARLSQPNVARIRRGPFRDVARPAGVDPHG